MESDGHGFDNTLPDLPGAGDPGQLDDLDTGAVVQGPADDDGGYEGGGDGFEVSPVADRGGGYENWEAPEKQDEASFPTLAASSPPAARSGRDDESLPNLNATMGPSSEFDMTGVTKPDRRIGRPAHQQEWEANTVDHLNHAKMLIQKAQAHHADNDRTVHVSGRKGKHQSGAVFTMIKKKMSMTNDLIKALEDRHESIEDTIRQVGECLFQVQRAHRSKWAPLNVCERRLELRDTRPLQELVRDHTQEALEHERQTLIESRQELNDQIAACKDGLLQLDKLKAEVVEDLSQKRHGLRVDRTCLSPSTTKTKSQERTVLPQLGEVSNYSLPPKEGSVTDENAKSSDTKALIHKAVKMEEDAMKLCNESDAVMLQTKRECQRASSQSQASLARRAEETDVLKRQVEVQMREIDEAIAQTEMSLGRTKKKLETQETPLKALNSQISMWGDQKSSNTGTKDPVYEEMEAHLESVKKNVKQLQTKYNNTKTLLEHLKESQQHLREDYRCKLLALKIEDACLKVTPRKAMELDRMDPRGGRCKVASARQKPPKKEGVYNLVQSMPDDDLGPSWQDPGKPMMRAAVENVRLP